MTVITPSLNQAAWIRGTLHSVRVQSYPSVQHIVMDGGSTDGTLAILEEASSAGDLQWQSQPDRGMYEAINKGLHVARGDVLTYLNADDLLAPWAIEAVMEVFQADPGVAVVYGDGIELSAKATPELKLQVPFEWDRIARYGSLVQPAVFWRRASATGSGAFDSDLQFVGDLDYWLRLGRSGSIRHVDEVLAAYRVHPDAKTSRFRSSMRTEELRVRRRHLGGTRGGLIHSALARISHGWAVRVQLARFAAALKSPSDPRWRRFRRDGAPSIRRRGLILAVLPLAGRRPPSGFVKLHGGWLSEVGPR